MFSPRSFFRSVAKRFSPLTSNSHSVKKCQNVPSLAGAEGLQEMRQFLFTEKVEQAESSTPFGGLKIGLT